MSKLPDNNRELAQTVVVDLDGTLVKTDTAHEAIALLGKEKPTSLLLLPFWLLGGLAKFKDRLSLSASPAASLLPYNEELVSYLREIKTSGRKLVLATASPQRVAESVADHLGLFDGVFGSSPDLNLKGGAKRALLVSRYGDRGFSYIGDSYADLPVWASASEGIVVSNSSELIRKAQGATQIVRTFNPAPKSKFGSILKLLRPHQWAKNLLLFIPLLAAHQLASPGYISKWLALDAAYGAVAFSLIASAVYVLNDLLDLQSDRQHRTKRARPLASGDLSLKAPLYLIPITLISGIWVGSLISIEFLLTLGSYWLITVAYSLRLKSIALLDIMTLAALYTIRILAGGVATNITVSPWLLTLSMFLFFSLACVKRLAELKELRTVGRREAKGRGYLESDLETLGQFGGAAASSAVLVLVLYANDLSVSHMYSKPYLLWFTAPVLLFWLARVLMLAQRGELHEDPVIFALKDRVSYLCAALIGALVFWAV